MLTGTGSKLKEAGFVMKEKWGDQRGLNPRHLESQSSALPAELWPPQYQRTLTRLK